MRRVSRIFFALFLFFVIVAAGALLMLDSSGSVFKNRSGFLFLKREKAVLEDTVVGEKPDGLAPLPGPVEEPEEEIKEPEPEEVIAETEEEPAEDLFADDTEEEIEEPAEPEEDKIYPIRYYTFVSINKDTVLNLRTEPDIEANIKGKLARGTKGWVLKPGNTWCYVKTTAGSVGWCSTEFLEFSEHSKKAFTNYYAQQVEPPTEELSSVFEDVWASEREKEQRAQERLAEEEAAASAEAAAEGTQESEGESEDAA